MAECNDLFKVETKVFKLEIENELRVLVGESRCVKLELLSGLAEIYGTEMVMNKVYSLTPNSSVSVYTWYGCSVKVIGEPESVSVATDTPMILHVVLHADLEQRRIKAEAERTKGPITLVVGPTDVGKSTLCRLLLNYASRLGRRPLFIDLDVGQNSISIPGSISVVTVEKPADIVEGFEDQAVQVYQYGYKSPGHNLSLYFLLLKRLGQTLQTGLRQANSNIRSSGAVINSCGWVRGAGYNAITLAAMAFEIDILCVLEEERLYTQLLNDMPSCVKVIFIPKMGGVVERSRPMRWQSRDSRVREYFYGISNQLHPFTFEVDFSDIEVYKVLTNVKNVETTDVSMSDVNVVRVPLGMNLLHQVLGLSSSDSATDDIILSHVIGFIAITHLDLTRKVVTVLSPQPSPLPKKICLMGDMRLNDRLS